VLREERDRLVDRLEKAARLGLERQRDQLARAFAHGVQVRDVAQQLVCDPRSVGLGLDRRAEAAGQAADAAVYVHWQQRSQ
jgi:hypothetical protein